MKTITSKHSLEQSDGHVCDSFVTFYVTNTLIYNEMTGERGGEGVENRPLALRSPQPLVAPGAPLGARWLNKKPTRSALPATARGLVHHLVAAVDIVDAAGDTSRSIGGQKSGHRANIVEREGLVQRRFFEELR